MVEGIGAGARYGYRLDGGDALRRSRLALPARRPARPSMVVDPGRYAWRDQGWGGVPRHGQVLYELHVGTFTRAGTWRAAAERLPTLAEVGITVVEMMPVNEFPAGSAGAMTASTSSPLPTSTASPTICASSSTRRIGTGIGVILDVVYNHLGAGRRTS